MTALVTPGSSRKRILMISPVMPSDRGNGLAMRAGFFLDAYARRFDVDLVVAPVFGGVTLSSFARSRAAHIEVLALDRADSHFALVNSVNDPLARLEAFRRYGRPSLTAFIGPACDSLARMGVQTRYQAVHVFRLYLAELATPWIGENRTRIVLDCDENDALAFYQIACMQYRHFNQLAAEGSKAEAAAFERFAALWLPKFDLVYAASQKEVRLLSSFTSRALAIPNVLANIRKRRRPRQKYCHNIVFVGSLGYAPNADAITWFYSNVWRRLQRALHHRVRLIIVGGNPPTAISRLGTQRGIKVTGAVPDVSRYYRDADLAIVPLRAGGGTRIKILEAALYGVPIVSTRFGAEGTTFQHRVDMLMANDAASFLSACLLLVRDSSLSKRMADRARGKAIRDYSPTLWRRRVIDLITHTGERCSFRKVGGSFDVGSAHPSEQS